MISHLEPYRPDTGPVAITAHFVAGGVSDGFVFENDPTSFYANLVRADGDLNGVVLNMAHEAYHVMQFRAQERAGINPLALASDTTPAVARLFATTLSEGTAAYASDPTRWAATGANVSGWVWKSHRSRTQPRSGRVPCGAEANAVKAGI